MDMKVTVSGKNNDACKRSLYFGRYTQGQWPLIIAG